MRKKNLVLSPCGNKAYLFQDSWLKYKEEKEFDLCLLFYHENINDPSRYADVDHFFHLKGFKWVMIHELFTRIHPEWLQEYEYFMFLDDDIEIDTRSINQLFTLSKGFGSWISCASLTKDSYCSWPMFRQAKNSFCRFVGQIEVMSPVFDRKSLELCMPTFIGNRSSWGIDAVWSKILGYPKDKLIVFDTITMRHTLPVGGGELYEKLQVDPHQEWEEITARYGAKKHNYVEYGRLQLVNQQSNRINFFICKMKEFFATRRQAWNDYDLNSRVTSRKNKLLGKMKSSVPMNQN